jgi:TRAP-type C4-dicarboxylate transport system substrate-binding protein
MEMFKRAVAAVVLAIGGLVLPGQATAQQNLVYANGYPKSNTQTGVIADMWIKRIEEATQGRVTLRHVAGGALLKPEKILEGVGGGMADAGALVVSFYLGQLPISGTLAGTVDLKKGNKLDQRGVAAISLKLLEEFPQLTEEFTRHGVTPVLWIPTNPYAIVSTTPISKLEDFRGKRIRVFGNNIPKLVTAAGAVPMSIGFGEVYTSLQTGLIDGAMTDTQSITVAKFVEVAPNVTTTGPKEGAFTAFSPVAYVFNTQKFESLSEEDREIILRVSREMTLEAADVMKESSDAAFEDLKKAGAKINHLSEGDTAEFASLAPDFVQAAADELNARGIPGTAIIAHYHELADQYISGSWKPWEK